MSPVGKPSRSTGPDRRFGFRAGVALDFGATAKALGADRAADAIARATGASVLVGLGGDLAVAGPPRPGGWPVLVTDDHAAPAGHADPRSDPRSDQGIVIASGGLADVGYHQPAVVRGDRVLHHVVDPATGQPAGGAWRTVSVTAASCVDANIASTAALVMGAAAPQWLEARRPAGPARHECGRDRAHVGLAGPDRERRVLAVNSQALWYFTRGTGVISLVLLTVSVALGVSQVVRFASRAWPRFVVAALHRNVSLLATVFVAAHIVTAVADSFAPIHIVDVFVPFVGTYRPIWLGLGVVAVDLLVAVIVTSLLRERIGYNVWRAVHWAAYACWPVALLHGLGTGSDTRFRWALVMNVACILVVLAAVLFRIGWTAHGFERLAGGCRDRERCDRVRRCRVDGRRADAGRLGPQGGHAERPSRHRADESSGGRRGCRPVLEHDDRHADRCGRRERWVGDGHDPRRAGRRGATRVSAS